MWVFLCVCVFVCLLVCVCLHGFMCGFAWLCRCGCMCVGLMVCERFCVYMCVGSGECLCGFVSVWLCGVFGYVCFCVFECVSLTHINSDRTKSCNFNWIVGENSTQGRRNLYDGYLDNWCSTAASIWFIGWT